MNSGTQFQYLQVPATELSQRTAHLQQRLQKIDADGALIVDSLHIYYFTGTIQHGVLFVPAEGEPVFMVRRSHERAQLESSLSTVVPLKGYGQIRTILAGFNVKTSRLGIAESSLSVAVFKSLSSIFPETSFTDISALLGMIRAVKSEYEIDMIRKAGEQHQEIYDAIPALIEEGITEWQLGAKIHHEMMIRGYTGIARFSVSNMELFMGIVSCGESGNYPTASIGPGGTTGLSPAFPLIGGLKKIGRGEPVFIDTGFGCHGYFTDKTRVFSLGELPPAAMTAHSLCLEIQEAVRSQLKPGAIPSKIYESVMNEIVLPRGFEQHFMGFGSNQVPFLGHGIGLAIDEFPVIAGKIHTPLQANMVLALEPKKGVEGIGLVGIENTFRVTENGGERLTPGTDEIISI